MQKLKCDVCGGNLLMADDRQSSTCENCGLSYSLNAMKDMIAALEGVQLNVKGMATDRSLIDYASAFLDTNVGEAEKQFQAALKVNPQNYEGWKGLFDCEQKKLDFHLIRRRGEFLTADHRFFVRRRPHNDQCAINMKKTYRDAYFDIDGRHSFIVYSAHVIAPYEIHGTYYWGGHPEHTAWDEKPYCSGYSAHEYIKKAIEFAPEERKEEFKQLESDLCLPHPEQVQESMKAFFAVHAYHQYPRNDYRWLCTKEEFEARENEERKYREEKKQEQSRRWAAIGLCRYCGGSLGRLSKKCKSCGKAN